MLRQCPALADLNLCFNNIGAVGGRRLRASWCGQASGLVLDETYTDDEEDEDEDEDDCTIS